MVEIEDGTNFQVEMALLADADDGKICNDLLCFAYLCVPLHSTSRDRLQ